ncbi:Polymerase/histidinol phosphatase-like protein [Mycotypha africana]|uniref:Polymerase/histidinol phosphatase-like protein n=1 Tax=Mycotypha africana TaxID=64632 RepID=UPI00230178D7|nr:Polymerase/histidinol phosphatase-like protein [Mycotypha africana]KAI8979286.1 Polymerase/histidinol phosphatase-like protein [Mycotypha africana]
MENQNERTSSLPVTESIEATAEEDMKNSHYEPLTNLDKSSTSSLQQRNLFNNNSNYVSHTNNRTTTRFPFRQRLSLFFCKHFDYFRGLLYRIITLIVIIGVLIAIGLGLRYTDGLPKPEDFSNLTFDWQINPRDYLKPYNASFEYNVLLDGHSHSTYSDGKMNVRQLLNWHIANGYNAVMVTDHNTIEGGLAAEKLAIREYNDTIVVIPGMEYTCCRIHMNLIGINQTIKTTGPFPTDEELQNVIDKVHELGGLVIVNHIPWSNTTEAGYQLPRLPNHPSIEQLISWGVDGFEVINQETFDLASYQATLQHNLIQMVGMDLHHPSVGAQVWLTVNTPSMTKAAILNEIRNRRTSFLFDPAGTRPRAYVDSPASFKALEPLMYLGDYFGMFYDNYKGMYSFQGTFCHPEILRVQSSVIGWFIFWIIVLMTAFELTRLAVLSVLSRNSLKRLCRTSRSGR